MHFSAAIFCSYSRPVRLARRAQKMELRFSVVSIFGTCLLQLPRSQAGAE